MMEALIALEGPCAVRESPMLSLSARGLAGWPRRVVCAAAPVRITIIDRSNHHLFQPLLYQVATAALSPADIAAPIRRIFRHQPNVTVQLADATAVNLHEKRVVLADGAVNYDILIVATGATHDYFGHEAWADRAPGLKTLKDALRIRQRVLMAFEIAEREADESRRRAWMTFVIVGAGPTGVELAGTLAEVSRQTLARDFRHIDTASARVILVEASPRVLGAYTEGLVRRCPQAARVAGRRGLDRSPGHRDRRRGGMDRPGADPRANGPLGRRGSRLFAGANTRRPPRPERTGDGRTRSDGQRP